MLDTKGPEICTMNMKDGKPVIFEPGQTIKVVTDKADYGDN